MTEVQIDVVPAHGAVLLSVGGNQVAMNAATALTTGTVLMKASWQAAAKDLAPEALDAAMALMEHLDEMLAALAVFC